MKNYPVEYYADKPLVNKAIVFLNTAKTLSEIQNRTVNSCEVSYYLLSHAIELIIKAVAVSKGKEALLRGHNIKALSEKYKDICTFDNNEMTVIKQLNMLNNGPGGLRYDNIVKGSFYPSIFNDGVIIVERLISDIFQ